MILSTNSTCPAKIEMEHKSIWDVALSEKYFME